MGLREGAAPSWADAGCLSAPSSSFAVHRSLFPAYCSLRRASQVLSAPAEDSDSGCSPPVQNEQLDRMFTVRAPCSALHPFLCCSPSSTGSFLTTFSRAARENSRQVMSSSCPAPSNLPGPMQVWLSSTSLQSANFVWSLQDLLLTAARGTRLQ